MLNCDRCGRQYVANDGSAREMEEAIRPIYEGRLRELTAEALARIEARGVRASVLERLLGLSEGYLSRLRSGKTPSEALVVLLRLIATNPTAKVGEIERVWKRRSPKRASKPATTRPRRQAGRRGVR